MKLKLRYILYLLSFIVVFPFSIPVYLISGFMTDSLESEQTVNLIFFGFLAFIAIFGSIILKYLFGFASKNNKYSLSIFIAHLVLIPLSYFVYNWILFY
ncbi:hypothetical protein [Gottfriedia luciferensis]|uniref:hypothetical protein n=1 Tax=Gottfriedia luciferensis TaxID=178774 RepID=UPI000B454DE4|nr:hypothetical protein [Gottfriedia luciferensis]